MRVDVLKMYKPLTEKEVRAWGSHNKEMLLRLREYLVSLQGIEQLFGRENTEELFTSLGAMKERERLINILEDFYGE